MIANRLAECWLEIKETLVERRGILAIEDDHLGARFAAANDFKGVFLDACDNRVGNRSGRFTGETQLRPGL
jgi:hypothetical protein